MNKYYEQKQEEIKRKIYDNLCLTEDKYLTTELIYSTIIDNLNIITDIVNHGR